MSQVSLSIEERRTVARALELMVASAERAAKHSTVGSVRAAHEAYALEVKAIALKVTQGAMV